MDDEKLKVMGKKIRLVITDMDGTLLTSGKMVGERTREAVRGLSRAGKGFTICTGRISTMIDSYVKELNLSLPIVTANGAMVWEPVEKKPLFEKAVPTDDAQNIMDYCKECGLDYSALTLGSSYFSTNSIRIEKFHSYNRIARREGIPEMKLEYLQKGHRHLRNQRIYKILVYEPVLERYLSAGRFLESIPGIHATCSDKCLWDVSAAGVSKGTGLAIVREYLGLKEEEICAFGDYDNDIPMLEQAGFPVAMKNGCDTIKSKAVYVTESNDEEGVAAVIETFLL